MVSKLLDLTVLGIMTMLVDSPRGLLDGFVDPRVASYPLMETPLAVVLVILVYLAFVLILGPNWMQDRKPFELRSLMIGYNFFLVVANAWGFLKVGKHGWFGKYNWICEPIDRSDLSEDALEMVKTVWLLLMLKLVELFDTVIFVLRKKTSQVTALHVLHHALVPSVGWYMTAVGPGGYNMLFPLLNTFVHTVMYMYYGMAALGPWTSKYLRWKKYLTTLQIGQFVIVFCYMNFLAIAAPCEVDQKIVLGNIFLAILFFALFLNFYVTSYRKRRSNHEIRLKKDAHCN